MAEQQQIAGIDRHAEMIDPAAGRHDRRRDHIAPVEDRRGAVDQQHLDPVAECVANPCSEFAGRMGAALLEDERAAERREPALGHLAGLVEDAFLEPRQPGLDQPDRARPERRDAQQRTARRRGLGAVPDRRLPARRTG